jgi:hypothetical protein
MKKSNWSEGSQVITIRRDEWTAVFKGRVQDPTFNSCGAAAAFVDGIENGTRKEECRTWR